MAKFNTGQSFADGDQVTGAKLNNIVGLLDIYSGVIADQPAISATVSTADLLLIADTDAGSSGAANKVTVQKLLNDTLTGGTFTNANIAEQLTYGTATGNRTVSTNAVITNGTITTALIPTGTFGTTTSTAATITSGTITTGLIPTLTAGTTTGTAGIFTSGTIGTLNSTTGTIGNLSTTLAGDFTISSGTGTLGTSGATAGTYGSVTAIPFITVDAKGRITSATTGTFSSTPADGSITFAKLSTSATEADNVAKRTAKAWVNFNGTGTPAIRSDFNVSSITDHGTGDQSVNFDAAFSDSNYCAVIGFEQADAGSSTMAAGIKTMSTSSVRIKCERSSGGDEDLQFLCLAAFSL
jgi:hypothetical protein